jgi:hypothetical protein
MATPTARFVAPINVGVLLYLEVEVTSLDSAAPAAPTDLTILRFGVALTRAGALSVFHHTAYSPEACFQRGQRDVGAQAPNAAASSSKPGAGKARPELKVTTSRVGECEGQVCEGWCCDTEPRSSL